MTARERAELAAEDYRKGRGGSLEEIIEWAIVAHTREAAAAMREAAADAAGKTCTCAAFWADYNRIDPQCGAHDAQETIAALPLPGDPK